MKTTEQIRRAGYEVLARELGPVAMVRFLQMFDLGSGDYTKERQQRQDEEARNNAQTADKGKMTKNV
jgi:hypothetical protein